MVQALRADVSLNIDPDQIYITGLSSGGGQAMVIGCLAPDIFAGVGLNANPTIGTSSDQINPRFGPLPITLNEAEAFCRRLAGDHWPAFSTQLASVIYGSNDNIVDQRYNRLNAEVKAALYGASSRSTFPVSDLPGHAPQGTGELWSDDTGPRVSLIQVDGMGHAWPAGSGPGGESRFVAREGANYPAYVTRFFFENNRRTEKIKPPTVMVDGVDVEDRMVTFHGLAKAAEGAEIKQLSHEITGLIRDYSEGPTDVLHHLSPDGQFTFAAGPLPDDNAYKVIVTAVDNRGASSMAKLQFDVGTPSHPPVIEQLSITVDGQCVAVYGTASDADGDLERVEVRINNGEVQLATLNEGAWAAEDVCGLAVGTNTVTAKAVDAQGLESKPVRKQFTIAPPYEEVTATLFGHVIAQRIRFYRGAGFGAADTPYGALLAHHGTAQAFPLYGLEGAWYADPAALLRNTFEEVHLRAMLTKVLARTVEREELGAATAARRFELPPTQAAALAAGEVDQFTLDQLLKLLSRAGAMSALLADGLEKPSTRDGH